MKHKILPNAVALLAANLISTGISRAGENFVEIDVFPKTVGQILVEKPLRPGVLSPVPELPPIPAGFFGPDPFNFPNPISPIILQNPKFFPLDVIAKEQDGEDERTTVNAIIRCDIVLGPVEQKIELQGPVTTVVRGRGGRPTGTFETEMISMSLTGQLPGVGQVQLREDVARGSTGQASVDHFGDGQFRIDSFFDVFTEISIDGGASWTPSEKSSELKAFESGVDQDDPNEVPKAGDEFRASIEEIIKFLDLLGPGRDGCLSGPVMRVDQITGRTFQGNDEIEDFDTTLSAVSNIGSSGKDGVDAPIRLTGPVQTRIHNRRDNPTGEFETEIITMDLHGSTPNGTVVMVRESPGQTSGGKTRITDLGGGNFNVDSFFDIWTEVSIDGGGSWTPADQPVRVSLGVKPPREIITLVGPTTAHVFFEGGNEGDANDDDRDGLDEVQTEIVSMNLTGRAPGGGQASVTLNPAEPSTGQIEEQVNDTPGTLDVAPFAGGGFSVDSFFDVWPEISIGTGPPSVTKAPIHLTSVIAHKPPIAGERYCSGDDLRYPLIDPVTCEPTGCWILKVIHDVVPTIECDQFPATTAQLQLELPPQPDLITPLVVWPPPGMVFRTPVCDSLVYPLPGGDLTLHNPRLRPLYDPLPIILLLGEDEVATFEATLRATLELQGQLVDLELAGSVQTVTRGRAGQTTGTWDTEIVSMSLSGSVPGGPTVEVHESSGNASTGRTTITDLGDRTFNVDSFFDIWTEVSINGGPFVESRAAVNLPAFQSGTNNDSTDLPPSQGVSRSPSGSSAKFTGLELQDVRHIPGVVLVDELLGQDRHLVYDSVLQAILLLEGIRVPVELHGPVETIVRDRQGRPTGSFNTEILSMDLRGSIPGGPTVVLRESPSLPSSGKTQITDIGDGRFHIDSFFDIWPEVSVGGGLWNPANGTVAIELVPPPPTTTLDLTGPTDVKVFFEGPAEGRCKDDDGDGLDEVPTEMVSLDLTGTHPNIGPVSVGLNSDVPSLGEIREQQNLTPGILDIPPFSLTGGADSFFDIWPEIRVGPQTLVPATGSTRVESPIRHKPPNGGERYVFAPRVPVELLDKATGKGTGIYILREIHTPAPIGSKVEFFEYTIGKFDLLLPGGGTQRVVLAGPTTVQVDVGPTGGATDSDGDGLDDVPTEIVSMDLRGNSPLGPVRLTVDPMRRTHGQIEEKVNGTPGQLELPPFTPAGNADSFFDVFFEIEVGGQRMKGASPMRMGTGITNCPPAPGEALMSLAGQTVDLMTWGGAPTGVRLTSAMHTPVPRKRTDVFPDTLAKIQIAIPGAGLEEVILNGPTTVVTCIDPTTGRAADTDADGFDEVPTEMVALDLTGNSSLGPVVLRLDPTKRSRGEVEEETNPEPGKLDVAPFAELGGGSFRVDSFFDVFFEVEVAGEPLRGGDPIRVETQLNQIPPRLDDTFMNPEPQNIDLLDLGGTPTGFQLVNVMHTPSPTDYARWAAPRFGGSPVGDPDNDANEDDLNNAGHFGFNTDPLVGGKPTETFKVHTIVEDDLIFGALTFPVRDACVFSPGGPSTLARFQCPQTIYEVLAGLDPTGEGMLPVVEHFPPVICESLPPLDLGWRYVTVRFLDPTRANPRAFLDIRFELLVP